MKWSSAIIAASCGLVAAHGDGGMHVPKILGARKFLSQLQAEGGPVFAQPEVRQHKKPIRERTEEEKRQVGGKNGRCGAGYGSCSVGVCCSAEGWCGNDKASCAAPDCLISYGPGCDGNKKPTGLDTSNIPRPKLGNVLYGGDGVYDCVQPGDIAITFDDGPYLYTNDLLDKFAAYGAKATFFITGNNLGKGMINDPSTPYPAVIRRMYAEGHQIASHTWSHENVSQLTNNQYTNQMIWNEIAFNSILGFFPTYMRPPFSICTTACKNILATLGYHAIYFDLDTQGYLMDDPKLIQTSKNIWDQAINKANVKTANFLQIEHDIHYQTVYNLTDYILSSLFKHGFKSVTVGECLGDPKQNWYRQGPGQSTPDQPQPQPQPSTISSAPTSTRPTITTIITVPTTTRTTPTIITVTSGSTAIPTGTPGPNTSYDGRCGADHDYQTCGGSSYGSCCNRSDTCDNSIVGCLQVLGCQPDFGTCI